MKESDFVKQNNEKWAELETSIESDEKNPQKISRLFIQITDDLSYARTFYRNRSVRQYLNGLAQILFNDINGKERFTVKKIASFFTVNVPIAMYLARKSILLSLIIFSVCFAIGVFTSKADPDFAKEILGSGYIHMTEENIEKGDPLAVYDTGSEMELFTRIAENNLRVFLLTFSFGILASIGTLLIIVINGVMVGVFQYFFIEKGLFWDSFLTIWTHGTLEIAAIIVGGGAGLILGSGLLFPGTYSRIEAFKKSARIGLTIVAGTVPIIFMAAFIEGFQTRHTDISDPLRFGFILMCFAFALFYFWWYPRRLAKKQPQLKSLFEIEAQESGRLQFEPNTILKMGPMISQTLALITQNFKKPFWVLTTIVAIIIAALIMAPDGTFFHRADFFNGLHFTPKIIFNFSEYPFQAVLVNVCLTFLCTYCFLLFRRIRLGEKSLFKTPRPAVIKAFILSTFICAFITFLVSFFNFFSILGAIVLLPLLTCMASISLFENGGLFTGIRFFRGFIQHSWGKFVVLSLVMFVFASALLLLAVVIYFGLLGYVLNISITDSIETQQLIQFGGQTFVACFGFFSYFVLSIAASSTIYFTLKETSTANNLFERIRNISITT